MFIIGTGKVCAVGPPIYLKNERSLLSAAARALANETPRIAFAPNFDLFFVPSSAIISSSIKR